jgi:hypothetical protein
MGGVMERFESEWRQGRCQLVEKLPRQRLRNLLRRQVAILLLVLLGEPIEMISTPTTRTTHACCVGGQMGCDRLQAQRQQSGSRHRLRAHLRHVRPLADSALHPSYASWAAAAAAAARVAAWGWTDGGPKAQDGPKTGIGVATKRPRFINIPLCHRITSEFWTWH